MSDTTSNTSRKLSLRELANQALAQKNAGIQVASTAAQAEGISPQALAALKEQALGDSELGKELLQVAKACEGVEKDPFAWRAFLSEGITSMARNENPDPRKFITLMRGAMSRFRPDSGPAYPLFVIPPKGTAQKWRPLFLSRIARDKESGRLRNHGIMPVVPSAGNDQDLTNLRTARAKAAAAFVGELEGELLANLRQKVWTACWIFPEASVFSSDGFEKFFEPSGDDLFIKKGRRNDKFRIFNLSEDEAFVLKESEQAQRLIVALKALEERVRLYWVNELDVEGMIGETLQKYPSEQRSPDQFVRKVSGIAAMVNPHWKPDAGKKKKDDKEISVTALFQRREDGAWRCLISSVNGAESMFGVNLRFHEWTDCPLPQHLDTFIRHAEQIEVEK